MADSKQRIVELDILRGIACLTVVVGHYLQDSMSSGSFLSFLGGLGGKGVWLFFAISGFVIFMTLESVKRPVDFIISRFSRLFPAYWFAVVLAYVLIHVFHLDKEGMGFFSSLMNMTMVQSFVGIDNLDRVYWTLQIELLFYAWMFILFVNKALHKIDYFLLAFLSISFIFAVFYTPYNSSIVLKYINELFILDHVYWFAMGIILYKLNKERRLGNLSVVVLLLSIVVMAVRSVSIENFLINGAVIFIFVLILFGRINWIKPLEFIGFISYPLYLIHSNLGHVLLTKFTGLGVNSHISIFLALFFVICIAMGITYWVEIPARKAIRKYCVPPHSAV